MRNPHAGVPFTDDDAAIEAALAEVSIPLVLCSLVHMTGDPAWIRTRALPMMASAADFQCGLSDDEQAAVRREALPAIAAYRDGGCEGQSLSPELLVELMSFLACKPLEGRVLDMLLEDMQFTGADGMPDDIIDTLSYAVQCHTSDTHGPLSPIIAGASPPNAPRGTGNFPVKAMG